MDRVFVVSSEYIEYSEVSKREIILILWR